MLAHVEVAGLIVDEIEVERAEVLLDKPAPSGAVLRRVRDDVVVADALEDGRWRFRGAAFGDDDALDADETIELRPAVA